MSKFYNVYAVTVVTKKSGRVDTTPIRKVNGCIRLTQAAAEQRVEKLKAEGAVRAYAVPVSAAQTGKRN